MHQIIINEFSGFIEMLGINSVSCKSDYSALGHVFCI